MGMKLATFVWPPGSYTKSNTILDEQLIVKLILIFFVGYNDFAFLATITGNLSPVPNPVVFNDARINPGDHYDPTTGICTVPLDGTYQFNVQIESNLDSDNDWGFDLVVDAERITYTRHDASGSGSSDENVSLFSAILLQLSAGQQVWIEALDLDGLYGSSSVMFSWFSGDFISAD